MNIAYITTYDANNVKNWSGLGYYIADAIKQQDNQLYFIDDLKYSPGLTTKINYKISQFTKKEYAVERDISVIKNYSKQVDEKLNKISDRKIDILFSPGTLPLAYSKSKLPKVIYMDGTFKSMIKFYNEFSNLSKKTIKSANHIEQKALTEANLCLFASDWAAQHAIEDYHLDPQKVKVVPFGANMTSSFNASTIKNHIDSKDFEVCHLLFVGVDWQRKGGDIVLKVAEYLQRRNIKVQLDIVGIRNLETNNFPDWVINHGFLNKNKTDELNKLISLYQQAHFFIMPSLSECYGIVYCEANSFGVPAIGYDTGGVSTAIKNDKNGFLFPKDTHIEEIGNKIFDLNQDNNEYRKLAYSSFMEYHERLNWSISGKKIMQHLKALDQIM